MNIRKNIVILFVVLFISFSGYSQERLSSLGNNPELFHQTIKKTKSATAALELPFIDDFSSTSPYPDQQKWIDSYAYINSNFGDNSPGIGVATLDAIDSTGAIYSNANITGFVADYLTSKPINMDIGGDTTAYLSFYYQPQGFGDAPEEGDSLVLEFYSPQDSKWYWMWSSPGKYNQEFEQVLIPIRGALFLAFGFQFRFSNIASLAYTYDPSFKTNADHWHIDYVYVDKNRHYQDYDVNDLVLQQNIGSLLLNYSSMPWSHFQQAGINEVSTIFPINLKNLSGERKYYEPTFTIIEEYGSSQGFSKELIADEIQAFQTLNYDATFNYAFTSDAPDSANFKVELDLNPTEQDIIPGNTRMEYEQFFGNYYAYDDGSSEAGYGITGEGTANATIAVEYHNFMPGDSLVGVSMFFNKSYLNENRKYFQLALWENENGKPGNLIYLQEGFRPDFENGLIGFEYFEFDSSQVVSESFFIGIKQVTSDFLNIGFDKNTSHEESIFYRIGTEWQNTSFKGSLMIRPVFDNNSKKTGINTPESILSNVIIKTYPNPVDDEINIDYPDEISHAALRIINLSGQIVHSQSTLSKKLSVRDLPSGTYFLIIDADRKMISKKFIKL